MPPFDTMRDGSLVERSGLNSVHDWPPLLVFRIIWQAYSTFRVSNGSIAIGEVQWQRYLVSFGGESSDTIHGWIDRAVPVRASQRVTLLP
jgi:hypothetical protein